ncbi:MAG: glycosyltransferase family 1 protein [Chloroflexota bacterium]
MEINLFANMSPLSLSFHAMHIGIDARLPYYQRGGISQYTLFLIQALARRDQQNRYTIFQLRKDGDSYLPSQPNFTRGNLFTPCHHRLESITLSAELLPHRLDLLHSPDFIPPRRGGKRHVITVHDLNFIYYPQFLTAESRRYYLEQIESAVEKADHISADSHYTREDVIERLNVPPEKITTVHLSVNPLYQRQYTAAEIRATLDQYKLSPGFILAVGTLEPRKNYAGLIQSYAKCRSEYGVDLPLVIIGKKGWLYDDIFETINALKLNRHVHHLSGIFDEALAHFYHGAGVLVTPSHFEGFGLPGLEALNCSCPIILSNRGSLPEIAGEAGLLLDPDDSDAWAETIYQVLHDSTLRERMISTGSQHAATFSWDEAARKTLDIYAKAVS